MNTSNNTSNHNTSNSNASMNSNYYNEIYNQENFQFMIQDPMNFYMQFEKLMHENSSLINTLLFEKNEMKQTIEKQNETIQIQNVRMNEIQKESNEIAWKNEELKGEIHELKIRIYSFRDTKPQQRVKIYKEVEIQTEELEIQTEEIEIQTINEIEIQTDDDFSTEDVSLKNNNMNTSTINNTNEINEFLEIQIEKNERLQDEIDKLKLMRKLDK